MMNGKRLTPVLIAALALIVALFYIVHWETGRTMADMNLNVRPFVATVNHYTVLDGTEHITAKETVARTRRGAVVHNSTEYGPHGIIVGNLTIQGPDPAMLKQPANCVKAGEKLDGEEMLSGQRAMRVIAPDTHTRRSFSWRLADFYCQEVQMLIQDRVANDWQTVSGSILTSFAETDPDPALFAGFRADWNQ